MKFIFIADAFVDDGVLGGGELNNHELMNIFVASGHEVLKINSHLLTPGHILENLDAGFVVSNFINLKEDSAICLMDKAKYVVYEHDHKYLKSRNPAVYDNYKAPPEDVINKDLYETALAVFCQSEKHANIARENLDLDNIISVGGNLWPESILNKIEELSAHKKTECHSVMNSPIDHKNTRDALIYCKAKDLKYEMIPPCAYEEFIVRLSKNETFVFFPKTIETLCRVVVEARMLGCKVITNDNVSATEEEWFSLKGKELIDKVRSMRDTIPEMVLTKFL
jgi:hypothetical protein|tara:strand:+ start:93 stop:935 length:843 start_codon:yes stop_codon:yes gene_type:complete